MEPCERQRARDGQAGMGPVSSPPPGGRRGFGATHGGQPPLWLWSVTKQADFPEPLLICRERGNVPANRDFWMGWRESPGPCRHFEAHHQAWTTVQGFLAL